MTTCCASPPPCPGHGEHPAPWAQAHARPSSHPQRPTESSSQDTAGTPTPLPRTCVHTHSLDRWALAEPVPPARPSRTQARLDESRNHRPEAQRAWGVVGPRRVPMNCGGGEVNLPALRLLVRAFYLRRELDLEVGCPRCPSPSSSSHRLPTSVWSSP